MRLVFGHDDDVADFVSQSLGIVIYPPFTAIGFAKASGLVGGAVFNGFNGSNIEVTMYAPRGMLRGVLRALAHYTFVQLRCNRVTARTKRSNKPVQRMLTRGGFAFEGVMKRYFGPDRMDDAMLYRLDKETALQRWIA